MGSIYESDLCFFYNTECCGVVHILVLISFYVRPSLAFGPLPTCLIGADATIVICWRHHTATLDAATTSEHLGVDCFVPQCC